MRRTTLVLLALGAVGTLLVVRRRPSRRPEQPDVPAAPEPALKSDREAPPDRETPSDREPAPARTAPPAVAPEVSAARTQQEAERAPLPGRPRFVPVYDGQLPHDAVPDAEPVLLLGPGRLTLGSGEDAGLRLDEPGVAPRHALVEVDDEGTVRIRDLGSATGLRVNGIPVVERELHDGDRVSLGDAAVVMRRDPPGR